MACRTQGGTINRMIIAGKEALVVMCRRRWLVFQIRGWVRDRIPQVSQITNSDNEELGRKRSLFRSRCEERVVSLGGRRSSALLGLVDRARMKRRRRQGGV